MYQLYHIFLRNTNTKILEQDLYEFEGMKFTSFKNYDLYLRRKFGDYKKDPEESQKVTHHQYEAYWK